MRHKQNKDWFNFSKNIHWATLIINLITGDDTQNASLYKRGKYFTSLSATYRKIWIKIRMNGW